MIPTQLTNRSNAMLTDSKSIHLGLLLLRICSGGIMAIQHGLPKLLKLYHGQYESFPDPLGVGPLTSILLAVLGEFFCGLLIVVGFKTRLSLIPAIATMFVAIVIVHAGDPFSKIEMALLYLIMYVVLFMTGPGYYSLDQYLTNKKGH